MTKVFWRDDSLVCNGITVKQYSDSPRTEIFINILERNHKDGKGKRENLNKRKW